MISHETAAVKRKCQVWGDAETAALRRLKADGADYSEIASILNRSRLSVIERWRTINLSEEEKERKRTNERKRRERAKEIGICLRHGRHMGEETMISCPIEIPAYVIAEREMRYMALMSRSITARLCGDPAPGWSALDRRTSR